MGTPKSSILKGCSLTNNPFDSKTMYGNPHVTSRYNPHAKVLMLRGQAGTLVPQPVLVQESLCTWHGGLSFAFLETYAIAWSPGSGQTGPGQATTCEILSIYIYTKKKKKYIYILDITLYILLYTILYNIYIYTVSHMYIYIYVCVCVCLISYMYLV